MSGMRGCFFSFCEDFIILVTAYISYDKKQLLKVANMLAIEEENVILDDRTRNAYLSGIVETCLEA